MARNIFHIVELDGAYFGALKSNGKRGHGTGKTSALAAASLSGQGRPKFFKIQVSKLDAAAVSAVVRHTVCPGSGIHSDALRAFHAALRGGYAHQQEKNCGGCRSFQISEVLSNPF